MRARGVRWAAALTSVLFLGVPGWSGAAQAPNAIIVSARASGSAASPADYSPTYYRPVIVDGKTFPLARSNFL